MSDPVPDPIALCASEELVEGGLAMPFDVVYEGEDLRAFAVRFDGRVHAYINRCTHVAMEMDFQANRFFDASGQWLICATHGAMFAPDSGQCVAGPGRGGLVKIELSEQDGQIFWHPTAQLRPVEF